VAPPASGSAESPACAPVRPAVRAAPDADAARYAVALPCPPPAPPHTGARSPAPTLALDGTGVPLPRAPVVAPPSAPPAASPGGAPGLPPVDPAPVGCRRRRRRLPRGPGRGPAAVPASETPALRRRASSQRACSLSAPPPAGSALGDTSDRGPTPGELADLPREVWNLLHAKPLIGRDRAPFRHPAEGGALPAPFDWTTPRPPVGAEPPSPAVGLPSHDVVRGATAGSPRRRPRPSAALEAPPCTPAVLGGGRGRERQRAPLALDPNERARCPPAGLAAVPCPPAHPPPPPPRRHPPSLLADAVAAAAVPVPRGGSLFRPHAARPPPSAGHRRQPRSGGAAAPPRARASAPLAAHARPRTRGAVVSFEAAVAEAALSRRASLRSAAGATPPAEDGDAGDCDPVGHTVSDGEGHE